jgi:hypothetical protein
MHNPSASLLNPVLHVDKEKWETFLSEFSELAKNYELILSKLDELNQRNEELARQLRDVTGLPTSLSPMKAVREVHDESKQAPSEKRAEQTITKTNHGILDFFRIRLTRRSQNFTGTYASCRRCSFPIRRASRSCVGCGVDFGAVVCPCGRTLSPNDKFCDRCGRITELH